MANSANVLVVGGGPAGSVTAALLARAYTRMLALASSMYECYKGRYDLFWAANRLTREHRGSGCGAVTPASFGQFITGLSDLSEITGGASIGVLTAQLTAEALRMQRHVMATSAAPPTSPPCARPRGGDVELLGLRVITEPRLGLQRLPAP